MKKIYLAISYTGMEERSFNIANAVTAFLMRANNIVFSPIGHSHILAKEYGLPSTWEYWSRFDESFIEWCDELWVVDMGAKNIANSKGVQAEIEIAKSLGKPIKWICPLTYDVQDSPIHTF